MTTRYCLECEKDKLGRPGYWTAGCDWCIPELKSIPDDFDISNLCIRNVLKKISEINAGYLHYPRAWAFLAKVGFYPDTYSSQNAVAAVLSRLVKEKVCTRVMRGVYRYNSK
jgi:hypothetical protein